MTAALAPNLAPRSDDLVGDGLVTDNAVSGDAVGVVANDVAAPAAAPAEPAPRPGAMKFRRKYTTVRLTPDQATRQGQVATGAFRHFGNRDAAMAFLNDHDEDLGGRPLDLAIASADGLALVEAAMVARRK